LLVSTHFAKLCKLALTSLEVKTAHETQFQNTPGRPLKPVLSRFFAYGIPTMLETTKTDSMGFLINSRECERSLQKHFQKNPDFYVREFLEVL
jgi:hypothetical protein